MRKLASAFLFLAAISSAPALADPQTVDVHWDMVRAPTGAIAIPVHGQDNPGDPSSEIESSFMGREIVLRNISYPTITPILPDPAKANGAAVIVAPGGGYMFLAMENEGWRVAQRLADAGYTAFVLKYRIRETPPSDEAFFGAMQAAFSNSAANEESGRPPLEFQPAVDDALAAIALVRANAGRWSLDPSRIGMIGFSAGARTTIDAVVQGDEAHSPDFFGYVYGPMDFTTVPENAPPMFAAIAYDDPLFDTARFPLATAWKEAGRPIELHVYGGGGHGFGLGKNGTTSTHMLDQFIAWTDMIGMSKSETTQ